MEIAKIFDQTVDIYQEFLLLTNNGSSLESSYQELNDKYRIHSQKKAIICECCGQPVALVLREGAPHFRHQGEPCPSQENYKRYTTGTRGGESANHKAGLAILRTYLEGQLKPHKISVQNGYMCKKALKMVPDFLLNFPDGTIWAVDYITGIREEESYNNYIAKRTETYKTAGFTPFYFIDSSWMANVPDRSVISLFRAEQQIKLRSEIDLQWTEFVKEFVEVFGEAFVLQKLFGISSQPIAGRELKEYLVYSLTYIDPGAGKAYIQRFIPTQQSKFGLQVYRAEISLERATSLDQKQQGFTWWEREELTAMQLQMQTLSQQFEVAVTVEAALIAEEVLEQTRLSELLMIQQEKIKKKITIHNETPVVYDPELASKLFSAEINSMINIDMNPSYARQILAAIKQNKSILSDERLIQIRNQARFVLGPIKNPNPLTPSLRSLLIDIAMA
ncbi:hypothetical protein SAMN05216312_1273 [Cohnella sp. OV330]|uniref:hypothetical protein n=1 Tax=Cohnella sp. OV330 TaxID=1855288 RepID=UPI0008ED485F|nr:hypothetical protein [Cohnella sp. OV330]SFB63032.1 hypothetical protein SAMN05216312_1273 [Cohnella sp. OV330]